MGDEVQQQLTDMNWRAMQAQSETLHRLIQDLAARLDHQQAVHKVEIEALKTQIKTLQTVVYARGAG